jgi:hypothetical protein
MGERWILSWLRSRLAGKDPYWPLDRRSDEDPDAKLVLMLRSAGPLHPASRSIGRAGLQLLKEAIVQRPAEPPAFFASLLRLCQQVPLPDVEPWFAALINELAEDPRETETRWGSAPTKEIVYAALQQTRGARDPRLRDSWQQLLIVPKYTTQALIALSPSFETEVNYLPAWWDACPPEDRPRELRQAITRAWKLEGDQPLREILSAKWLGLPGGLRNEINMILSDLRLQPIDSRAPAPVSRAIPDAGQRPDLVLSRERERYSASHGS